KSPLPKNSKKMHEFINSMAIPNLDFKKKFIIDFEGIPYILYYCPIIKTIKTLLQKSDMTKDFVFQFEEKVKVNMIRQKALIETTGHTKIRKGRTLSEIMDPLQVEGVKNLFSTLDTFLDNTSITSLNNNKSFVQLYKCAVLQLIDIIRADSSYNNALWFSDVAIAMDAEEAINYTTN
ncbi:4996_t:CDS:2, partial [Funneliformis caledonium]